MLRHNLLPFIFMTLLVAGSMAQFCPSTNSKGTIFSSNIIAALNGGDLPISQLQDSICYNYSLPYTFNTPPDVAIAVNNFDSESSNGLYFYIKPLRTSSLISVPFVVRTQWPYSKWNQISFSFVVEDRSDIESGYYQIDSGPLAGCDNGKSVDVLLPFRTFFNQGKQIQYNLFLHGFEISTTVVNRHSRSPYEIQIIASSSNTSGIAVSLSVTTITQVNSIYISYFAFQNTDVALVGGNYVYDIIANPTQTLFYAPQNSIPRNYARIYGITGFLLNYNKQRLSLKTTWDGYSFTFQVGTTLERTLLQYFSFSFIFFTGSQCQDCSGYQIYYNNSCLNYCPAGTSRTNQNTCINCGSGKQWNGSACVITCPAGQYLSPISNICECPPTLNWNGESCIPCTSGRTWNSSSRSCQCQGSLIWNGQSCIKMDACTNGKVWDVFTYTCTCPEATYWNNYECVSYPQCYGGQTLNSLYQCTCPNGYVWSQNLCIFSPCLGGQIWTGSKCICSAGLNFNGTMCLQCINGQKWNASSLSCSCESGYKWNGAYCEVSFSCSNGRVWDATYKQCICPSNHYWSGYSCLAVPTCLGGQYFDSSITKCVCLSGYQWNGKSCLQCNNGRTWNVTSLTCTCPIGTVETKNGCTFQQQCTGGKQWNQNKWSCDCPATSVWNGAYCIANACTNGRTWNESLKACQCMGNKVWINDTCVPPQIGCINGQVWNQYIYACECPQSTYNAGTTCVSIPTCQNGKVYNPLNNKCQCPFGLIESGSGCSVSTCPSGQYYNSKTCQVISCPPPSYFSGDRCVVGGNNQCDYGYSWNGNQCVFCPVSCPDGTTWNTTTLTCQSSSCGTGFYSNSNGCYPLPQQCIPPTKWQSTKCTITGGCPSGTYSQGSICQPYTQCSNGYVWDSNYIKCVCPYGAINTGNKCVECPNQQKWSPSLGCACPDGTFDLGASCDSPNSNKCNLIANAIWSENKCVCRPGFTKVGYQCVCYGTQTGSLCDRCSHKPNSNYIAISGTCECKTGFSQIRGQCVATGSQPGTDESIKCNVGTYFDMSNRMCLACPDGCLSCRDCYTCNVCRPEFFFDAQSNKCIEYCGDGKKFYAACDDGNNQDGDGCSRDCKIESGYTCTGGSSTVKDNCYVYRPSSVNLAVVGQIRMSSSIILNVKFNYFPASLLSATECENRCSQIINATIVDGDKAVSIVSEYVSGTSYVFTITVQFGRSYMGNFKAVVGVNSALSKYFGSIPIQPLEITIQPSYLAAVSSSDILV